MAKILTRAETPFIKYAERLCERMETKGGERKVDLWINREALPYLGKRDIRAIEQTVSINHEVADNVRAQWLPLEPAKAWFEGSWIKGHMFDATQPITIHTGDGDVPFNMKADSSGKFHKYQDAGMPQGGDALYEAVNEFIKTWDLNRALARSNRAETVVTTKYPLAWGQIWPDFPFIDRFGVEKPLGFIALSSWNWTVRRGCPSTSKIVASLEALHNSGFVKHSMHMGNLSSLNRCVVVHDMGYVMNYRDNMTSPQILAHQAMDLLYAIDKWLEYIKQYGVADAEAAIYANDMVRQYFKGLNTGATTNPFMDLFGVVKEAFKAPIDTINSPIISLFLEKMGRASLHEAP